MQLVNLTPFKAERFCLVDAAGAETLVVVVKGTYGCDQAGKLVIADEQAPISMADEYYGEPGKSSVRYASEACLMKTGTDVALLGHAFASSPKETQVDVSLKLAGLEKTVRVFGDRVWNKGILGARMSAPEAIEKIPLTYERAFGGADVSSKGEPETEWRNPVGTGFRAKGSSLPVDGSKLPNLEDPRQLMSSLDSRPSPSGFGFVAPSWEPRKQYVGTYDDKWKRDRMPLVPEDFNPKFFSCAAAGLTAPGFLKGDEAGEVNNAGAPGIWKFALPGHRVEAVVDLPASYEIIPLVLETAVVEADSRRVLLTWKGQLNIHGKVFDVGWVKTQFMRGAV